MASSLAELQEKNPGISIRFLQPNAIIIPGITGQYRPGFGYWYSELQAAKFPQIPTSTPYSMVSKSSSLWEALRVSQVRMVMLRGLMRPTVDADSR